MINYINKEQVKDRNGLELKYGDKVYLKSYWSQMYLFTIIGFTKNYVACMCGSQVFYRKTTNLFKIYNQDTFNQN